VVLVAVAPAVPAAATMEVPEADVVGAKQKKTCHS
jgi:hypothetical protein